MSLLSQSFFNNSSRLLNASALSLPSALIEISAPWPIPRDITPIMDFKLTFLPLYSKLISESNLLAVCTSRVAGLA
jgi:hypothetical protein